jgi:threonine synthase
MAPETPSDPPADELGVAVRVSDRLRCSSCDGELAATPRTWCCPACGGPLDFAQELEDPLARDVPAGGAGVWRYAEWIGLERPLSLGEPTTPLTTLATPEGTVTLKHDGLLPSGSFKDRGAATLTAWLAACDVERIVVDSSGNAGAALAAYCARAGIRCEVFVPGYTSPAKLAQADACGAVVRRIDGSREDATAAAQQHAADSDAVYASHKWSPAFLVGTATLAYELWEQGDGMLPDAIVMPVGAGTLALGVAAACAALRRAGRIDRLPRLLGVQSTGCAPVAAAFGHELPGAEPSVLAEGIQILEPPRLGQLVAAFARSGGSCLAVGDAEIRDAAERLAHAGILVEPTSAAALAGWTRARQDGLVSGAEQVAVVLTGNGLKTLGASSHTA